ncbi:MAG: DUF5009 domain-containing protein, partial [bacterium]|nr:DUF5009 domain-containing protein [bacterium]
IPVTGYGADRLSPEGSWVSCIDQMVFLSNHLLGKTYDPEGLLSTIPSLATTLLGVLTGGLVIAPITHKQKFLLLILIGGVCLLLGGLWNFSFPINKNLWTSSFVLWTGGFALSGFALCFFIIDILGFEKWALPLKIFGMNALFAFMVHVLLLKCQFLISWSQAGRVVHLKEGITTYLFGAYTNQTAALFYALSFIFLNFLIVAFLYWRKLFIRI